MNLELVEQECFLYLTQCQNPLVPFDSLLAHLRQNAEFAEVTSAELLEFFRDHALFKIVEPSVEPRRRPSLASSPMPAFPPRRA